LKPLFAALLAVAALTVVSSAYADPMRYGVADDWPKFHPCGDIWWTSVKDIAYQDVRMTVQWNEATPTVIPFQSNLKMAIDCAKLNNIRPILAIYPLHPSAIGSNAGVQAQFATFVSLVGQAFPDVKDFIVGNEPNVNRFWQPQYVNGQDAAATDYEHTLAQSYDAIKGVRPDSTVWGPAISSRGNDNANAASNPSHSPVWFIKYMGDAYKASGRSKPIFDEFNFHPYPPTQDTDPFSKPFQWPQAGAANLDRIKQAIWDAFNGTAQPTVTEQPGGKTAAFAAPQRLPIDMDEAGEQTVVTGHEAAYDGTPENVIPISEAQQSTNHVELSEIGACDPAVKTVLYFPLIDDTGISSGFQSGNLFADLTKKQSYAGMKAKIASAHGNCQGGVPGIAQTWAHTEQVIGALGIFGGPGTDVGSQPTDKPAGTTGAWTSVTVNEDATYVATLSQVTSPSGGGAKTIASLTGTAKAYFKPGLHFTSSTPLAPGYYQFGIVLKAATNPSRTTTLTSKTFKVGTPGGSAKPGKVKPSTVKPAKAKPGKVKPVKGKPASTKPAPTATTCKKGLKKNAKGKCVNK
jgi:hypothetical protein